MNPPAQRVHISEHKPSLVHRCIASPFRSDDLRSRVGTDVNLIPPILGFGALGAFTPVNGERVVSRKAGRNRCPYTVKADAILWNPIRQQPVDPITMGDTLIKWFEYSVEVFFLRKRSEVLN